MDEEWDGEGGCERVSGVEDLIVGWVVVEWADRQTQTKPEPEPEPCLGRSFLDVSCTFVCNALHACINI